jgi:hypothetical protein
MTTTQLLIIFASLLALYSVLLFVSYRPLTGPEGVRFHQSKTPVETTTAEERSHGESSFIIRKDSSIHTTRGGFFVFAIFGYIGIFVGFAIAFIFISRSAHA